MNEETITATPAEQASPVEQVQAVEGSQEQGTEATTAQTQVETPEASEEKAKKEPWFQKRIGELTREKYEAKRQAAEATELAQQLRQQMSNPQAEQPTGNVETLIQQEARRMVAEKSFNDSCNKVYATGKAEFPDFDASVANLQMVGMNRDFLEFTAASDAGAKLLHHLGRDLDEAARIASLPPVLMARELTRLEIKLGQTPAKPVSKVPAPIAPISGTSGGSKDPSEMSDAEFAKWRKAQIAQRNS